MIPLLLNGVAIIVIISVIVIRKKKLDDYAKRTLSPRNYWRYKNGGID